MKIVRKMRKEVWIGLLAISLLGAMTCQKELPEQSNDKELSGTITLSGAWALYPMAVRWAEEFQKIHPKVNIDIAAGGAGKGMADCLAEAVDLGMVSRDIFPAEIEKGAYWFSVTMDAVVPTVNEQNPVLKELLHQGVTKESLIGIWITGAVKEWGAVCGVAVQEPIRVYTRSDACGAAQTWAQYLGKNQEDLLGVGVYGDPGLAEAVGKDELGIGFNNINYAYDAQTKRQVKLLRVLPIDINGNGQIDADEDFYTSMDEIIQAIGVGKYPSPPARLLHFVSQGRPKRKIVQEFVKWVLTQGQQYVSESGYIKLPEDKIRQELEKLAEGR